MDDLWSKTQDPKLHQRWDLRFGEIDYLPKADDDAQQFTYATVVAPGVRIAGTGESLGDKDRPDGSRWSGLKFWADDWRSPIKAGAGYWRYLPTDDGIRFLTRYDYRPRWGAFGELVDKHVFRPCFGWATAWSFDRLRLWLEKDIPPEQSRNQAVAHASAVTALSFTWLFHGLVPKWIVPDAAEVEMMKRANVGLGHETKLVKAMGLGEAALGMWMIARPRSRAPFVLNTVGILGLTVGAWKADRRSFFKAFNPASINFSLFALGLVALTTRNDLPSGTTPLRTAPDTQPDVEKLPEDKR
jgi:hypothetical protein